ncbi:hypothetical protein [Seonamhaeicola sp.]|uniref:PKD domain-containing protein n=1 Tax=Seonamhaeicola sp. TaxID=1912245 RepID=UPI00262894B4|nr:hypothetical protein [Seonamhaeicola sp.]
MSTKLHTITTQYRKFNTNQVLTESQLNEFLDYFEDQDHLSRIGLSGVGLVCGFKVTYNALLKTIKITQGYGVTTDGDLLTLLNPSGTDAGERSSILKSIDLLYKTYTHFKVYQSDKVKYKPFFYSGDNQIELWELQTEAEIAEGDTSYSKLELLDNLEDKVVLLYLENYSKEGDLCTEITCDNQGIDQVARLKVLLVSTLNARYIAGLDPIYNAHDWYDSYLQLPVVSARRVILNCENTKTFKSLKQNYFNAIKSNLTLPDLKLGYDVIFSKFNRPGISSKITAIFNMNSNSVPLDFQYRYDVLKDLIDTYNDIKDLLLHINVHCCPDIGSFPKHLMLGKLEETEDYLSLRHRFYKSPIIGHEDHNYKCVLSLLNRAEALVNNYLNKNKSQIIKITPSQAFGDLEHKAIPFYYNVNDTLIDSWSYNRYTNFSQKHNLSYHTTNLAPVAPVQRPLEYNMDNNNFYRIEGHQGKPYREALEDVLKLKKQYGLNFDVKVLSVNPVEEEIDLNDYKCEFEDLSVLLKAWTVEQECILASITKFFAGLSTKEVGKHVKEAEYVGRMHHFFPITEAEPKEEKTLDKSSKTKYRYRRNVVKDNVGEEDHTIGKYMKLAFEKNKGGSANDIKHTAKILIDQDVNTSAWAEHGNTKNFLYNTVELIGLTAVLTEKAPQSLFDLDALRLSEYELSLKDVCALVKKLQATYQSIAMEDDLKQVLGMLINQLSVVCCSEKKLKILFEEIKIRKQRILLKIQLCPYVKYHPGLEHLAGVMIGGTFIMVYLAEAESVKDIFEKVSLDLEFLTQPAQATNHLKLDSGHIRVFNDERISVDFAFASGFKAISKRYRNRLVQIGETLEETVQNLAEFLNYTWRVAGASKYCLAEAKGNFLRISLSNKSIKRDENYVYFKNPKLVGTDDKIFFETNRIVSSNVTKKNTVIADFALPYMCCSDCAPVNFIIPKEPVFLSLPEPHICLHETTVPILFVVSPKNAIVKALVDDGLNGGVTTNEHGQFVFDARLVSPELYGTLIRFTVNDEETDCKITVYDSPDLLVSTDIQYNQGKTRATVRFRVLGDIPDDIVFSWDLGNGTTLDEKPDANGVFTYIYNLPVNDSNIVKPVLTISNGFCDDIITIEEIEFEKPVDVNLRIREHTCIDTTSTVDVIIPFTNLSPVDGTIKIVNAPVAGMSIVNNELVIKPGTFVNFNTAVSFTVNDLPTTAAITVSPVLEIEIIEDKGSFFWKDDQLFHSYFFGSKIPANPNATNLDFEWIINEVVVGTDKNLQTNLLIKEGENPFVVTLNVTDPKGCTATETVVVTIKHPIFSLGLPFNRLNYCTDDNGSYKISVKPVIRGTIVTGPGLKFDAQGNALLVPSAIGPAFGNTPSYSVAGKELLKIVLHQPAKARFTPIQQGNKIILRNDSTGNIKSSKWFFNNKTKLLNGKKNFTIDLQPNGPVEWVFKLEVTNDRCGTSSTNNIPFVAIVSNDVCMEETTVRIKKDQGGLDPNTDLPGNLRTTVLAATIRLYKQVLSNPGPFLEGENNEKLLELFQTLTNRTFNAIATNQDGFVINELSKLYSAQIKLFYNIIHCQPHAVLTADKTKITPVSALFAIQFKRLREAGKKFDPNNDLKKYLNAYIADARIIKYVATAIKNQLIPQIP